MALAAGRVGCVASRRRAASAKGPRRWAGARAANAEAPPPPESTREDEVLAALRNVVDPDLGADVVECGFVKDLEITPEGGVSFRLELTTPACPVKEVFERDAKSYVSALPWVCSVAVVLDAAPSASDAVAPVEALRRVTHVIAVSSCKGGVGKSTVAVNLAYALRGMGAKVGIFDADVYGPSLPTMVSPETPVLEMDPETRALTPVEYEGVKVVSFGFAGQGSAIMRGPMVSGLVQQLLTTSEWGELDYLIMDFPPGTGDIQLTLCQSIPITAAVVVTTPQKLAFIDVAKGVRMFAKLRVPCVAVVENMAYFDGDDGKRYFPFGQGSGAAVCEQFGIPHLFQNAIAPELAAAGDGGRPRALDEPAGPVARTFDDVAVAVVQEVAKLRRNANTSVDYDEARRVFAVNSQGKRYFLHPATVRRNDTSAKSLDEWTGQPLMDPSMVPEDVAPQEVVPLGNYAVQITWQDGFNQVAPFDLLDTLERVERPPHDAAPAAADPAEDAALRILADAQER